MERRHFSHRCITVALRVGARYECRGETARAEQLDQPLGMRWRVAKYESLVESELVQKPQHLAPLTSRCLVVRFPRFADEYSAMPTADAAGFSDGPRNNPVELAHAE